jgi:hypothetical protein
MPSPPAVADLGAFLAMAVPVAHFPTVTHFLAGTAFGALESSGSPSHAPDVSEPEQPESPSAGSPPTLATTPLSAAPVPAPNHGTVPRFQDNTHHEKKYTDGTIRYNPQRCALFAALVSHHDAHHKPS